MQFPLLCLFLLPQAAQALSWQEAQAEAAARHPSLLSAQADVRASEADRGGKRAAFLPKLDASADLSRSGSAKNPDGGFMPLESGESGAGSYGAGLRASWRLFDGFSSLRSLQEANHQLMSRRHSLDQESVDLLKALRSAFVRALYAQEQVKVAADILDRRALSTRYQALKFEAGRQPRWIWKKAEADEMDARWRLDQSRLDLGVTLQELAQALGREESAGLSAEGSLESGEPEAADLEALKNLPAWRRLDAQRMAAEARVSIARAAYWPTLSGSAGWNYSGAESWPPPTRSWSVGLNAGFNIFNGGATYAAVASAEEALESLIQQELEAKRGLKAALLRAHARALSSSRRVAVGDAQLEAARERYDTVLKLSEAGRAGYLDLEQAETGLASAQQQGLALRQEAALAAADLDAALGRGLAGHAKEKP